jgi:hypothetical protein
MAIEPVAVPPELAPAPNATELSAEAMELKPAATAKVAEALEEAPKAIDELPLECAPVTPPPIAIALFALAWAFCPKATPAVAPTPV